MIAYVPLKGGAATKSRLATVLTLRERLELADRMARHVVRVLKASGAVTDVVVICPERNEGFADVRRIADPGGGLNAALAHAMDGAHGALVVHADLPLLTRGDIAALAAALDEADVAFAPDRHGHGVNALALRAGVSLPLCFGPASAARFRTGAALLGLRLREVRRRGLALDVDTPDDLAEAGLLHRPDDRRAHAG
jgi:2-phospho-L-lactate guanylyltransferase